MIWPPPRAAAFTARIFRCRCRTFISRAWGKKRDWVFATLEKLAAQFRGVFGYLSVGAQDASRADADFLCDFAIAARENGLARLRLADTVGILTPLQTCQLIRRVKQAVPDLPLEFHGHNDLGMATANTIAAFEAGANARASPSTASANAPATRRWPKSSWRSKWR